MEDVMNKGRKGKGVTCSVGSERGVVKGGDEIVLQILKKTGLLK